MTNIYFSNNLKNTDFHWIEKNCSYVAIDTETTGLDSSVDELKIIQIYTQNRVWIIKFDKHENYKYLKYLLENDNIQKIFHNAVFDLGFLVKATKTLLFKNIVCTKIASKILFGINHKNSLKDLLKEFLSININKDYQTSDWGQQNLSVEQINYIINDVQYLEKLWKKLENLLILNNKLEIAKKSFEFIPYYLILKNSGIKNIFEY